MTSFVCCVTEPEIFLLNSLSLTDIPEKLQFGMQGHWIHSDSFSLLWSMHVIIYMTKSVQRMINKPLRRELTVVWHIYQEVLFRAMGLVRSCNAVDICARGNAFHVLWSINIVHWGEYGFSFVEKSIIQIPFDNFFTRFVLINCFFLCHFCLTFNVTSDLQVITFSGECSNNTKSLNIYSNYFSLSLSLSLYLSLLFNFTVAR